PGVGDGSFKRQGIDAGHAAAEAMVAARQYDGRFGPSQWFRTRAQGTGRRCSTPATTRSSTRARGSGGVTPFLIESGSQVRRVDPLPIDGAAYAADVNEVKAKGSATAPPDVRTPTQTYIARWWQSNPMISWNDVCTQLARSHGFDALAAARLFAMQNLSGA